MKRIQCLRISLAIGFLIILTSDIFAQKVLKTDAFEIKIEKGFVEVTQEGKTNKFIKDTDEYKYWLEKFYAIESEEMTRDLEIAIADIEETRDFEEAIEVHVEQAIDHEEIARDHEESVREHLEDSSMEIEVERKHEEALRSHEEAQRDHFEAVQEHMEKSLEHEESARSHNEAIRDHEGRIRHQEEILRDKHNELGEQEEQLIETIQTELIKDSLIESIEDKYRFEYSNKEIKLNGKELSNKLFIKYKQILNEFREIKSGSEIVISNE